MNSTSDLDICHDSLYPVSTYDEIGYHFLRSGRPGSVEERRGSCIVIAVAMFRFPDANTLSMDFHFWNRAEKGTHSETLILNRLQETENKLKSVVEVLKLYGSLSPCGACCGRLIDFLNKRPSCKLHVAFSRVYKYEEEEHRSALRELNAHLQIKALNVFKEQDWEFLRTRGNLKLSLADKQWMDRFDTYWQMKLNDILQDAQPMEPQNIAAPSPAAATAQNQNTASPRRRARRIKKNGQIAKPGRIGNNLISWWNNTTKKKAIKSVTSGKTEKQNSVSASVNSGQQIHNSTATNTGQQTSMTESLQLVSASTSRNPPQQTLLDESTNVTEGFIGGNAQRQLTMVTEDITKNKEVSEKRAREVQESAALRNSAVTTALLENTANGTTNLFVDDNESIKL